MYACMYVHTQIEAVIKALLEGIDDETYIHMYVYMYVHTQIEAVTKALLEGDDDEIGDVSLLLKRISSLKRDICVISDMTVLTHMCMCGCVCEYVCVCLCVCVAF